MLYIYKGKRLFPSVAAGSHMLAPSFTAMSLVMKQCVPSDAPGFAEAFISAYERRPRHIVSMGSVSRERQLAIFTAAFRDSIESQEHPTPNQETHCLIVTDPDTNEIVAFAIWIHLPNGYRKDEDTLALVHDVPEGANEKLMREVSRMTTELRGDHEGRKGPHWSKLSPPLRSICLKSNHLV